MPMQVVNGAQLMCSFGAAPSSLVVLPVNRVVTENQNAANIMDLRPDGQHHALRDVHEHRQPASRRRNLGCARRS